MKYIKRLQQAEVTDGLTLSYEVLRRKLNSQVPIELMSDFVSSRFIILLS